LQLIIFASCTQKYQMGHGNSDKLYITHAEHSGLHGSHSASSGYRTKAQAPAAARTPFDCCALSFQPFSHPVCARNADGTGHVFDLVNIIPWLKQHDNTHPITKEPVTPASLHNIALLQEGSIWRNTRPYIIQTMEYS
ncbi:hypothetical protein MPER_06091, partial [Moniliophthora perniciosa FA553]